MTLNLHRGTFRNRLQSCERQTAEKLKPRYVGTWRLAYGYDLTRLHGARLGSHEVSIDRYYGDRDVVGLRLGHGKEASQRPGGVLVAAGVSAAWVRGTHWFSPRWALDWSAGHVAQDVGYDRTWMQLGLRREF